MVRRDACCDPREARREQMAAYGDGRGVDVAVAIVRGKLSNQASLLKYFGKYQKTRDPGAYSQLTTAARAIGKLRADVGTVAGDQVDTIRATLLASEGAAGRHYWANGSPCRAVD